MKKLTVQARTWAVVALASAMAIGCGGEDDGDPNAFVREKILARGDTTAPTIKVVVPTSNSLFASSTAIVHLEGTAKDNQAVSRVTWVAGTANGVAKLTSSGAGGSWTADVPLLEGDNAITVRAYDASGNRAAARIAVSYDATPNTVETQAGTWTQAAQEGQSFKVDGTARARFGSGNAWVERSMSGTGDCTTTFFGSDPMVGAKKSCEVLTAAATVSNASNGAPTVQPPSSTPTCSTGTTLIPASSSSTGTSAPACTSTATTSPTSPAAIVVPTVMTGPAIDAKLIPTGSPGLARDALLQATDAPTAIDNIGAFRTVCDYSHMAWDDPIVAPGKPGASHLHAFFGNTLTNANSTIDSLKATGNSTCRGGTINRSGYWVPALIDTRDGRPLTPSMMIVYYKSGYDGLNPSAIKPMPAGLRMIAGSSNSSAAQERVQFGCLTGVTGIFKSIPVCPAGSTLIASIVFPQCWDGKNLDTPDHKSHMAYPAAGACPSTHPVALPAITFNVRYDISATDDMRAWRLSSDTYSTGTPGGFSFHGDWMNGWRDDIVNAWMAGCINKTLDCHAHLLGDGRQLDLTYNEGAR